ncbi:hypothetical protein GO491_07725 [Flavobacteriaceae bacterium Ap0902]|nr:hypothetical protein [Flavobacteriaceae bacterium Ap0902]
MIIDQNSFVLFRLPNQNVIEFWELKENKSDNGKFIFHSFDNTKHLELFAKAKQFLKLSDLRDIKIHINHNTSGKLPYSLSKKEYLEKAEDYIEKLNHQVFDKIILSRVKIVDGINELSFKFMQLCEKYPNAWIYLFHHNQETWLGASPERLLFSDEKGFKTVALAATKSTAENRDWNQKEYKEHNLVVEYITSKFEEDAIKKHGPYTIDLGEIQHLKTDIDIVDDSLNLNQVLEKLHPTPAVCGMPKDKTMKYIIDTEDYDRSYYTGYFGIVTEEHTEFNVNLRCAQLFQNKSAIYIGGGLVAESKAESEWNETEMKSRALL